MKKWKFSLFTHALTPQSSAAGEAWMTQGVGICSALLNPREIPRPQWSSPCFLLVELGGRQKCQPAELCPALEMCPPHHPDCVRAGKERKTPQGFIGGHCYGTEKSTHNFCECLIHPLESPEGSLDAMKGFPPLLCPHLSPVGFYSSLLLYIFQPKSQP